MMGLTTLFIYQKT